MGETEPELLQGEHVFYRKDKKKGIFRRRIVETLMITSKAVRVNQYALYLSSVAQIEIADKHAKSRRTYSGHSFGPPRSTGINARTFRADVRGYSQSYGDMFFFDKEGNLLCVVDNVPDAAGLERLVKVAQPHIR